MTAPLVCSFESRRANEMRSLIERFGGRAFMAPSMQEVPVENNAAAIDAIRQVVAGNVANLALLTGVGTEAMLKVAESQGLLESLLRAMSQIPLFVRGPKPAAALRKLGLKYAVTAREPNTWIELLAAIDAAGVDLSGEMIAVQEYGVANEDFYKALESRGATVLPIPVYRWELPGDTDPLKNAIEHTIAGEFAALIFTSAQQVRHVLMVADTECRRSEWLAAAQETVVASIGPTCTETLQNEGLTVRYEASPPKMGPLIRGMMEYLSEA